MGRVISMHSQLPTKNIIKITTFRLYKIKDNLLTNIFKIPYCKLNHILLFLCFQACLKCNICFQGLARAKLNQEASSHKLNPMFQWSLLQKPKNIFYRSSKFKRVHFQLIIQLYQIKVYFRVLEILSNLFFIWTINKAILTLILAIIQGDKIHGEIYCVNTIEVLKLYWEFYLNF